MISCWDLLWFWVWGGWVCVGLVVCELVVLFGLMVWWGFWLLVCVWFVLMLGLGLMCWVFVRLGLFVFVWWVGCFCLGV